MPHQSKLSSITGISFFGKPPLDSSFVWGSGGLGGDEILSLSGSEALHNWNTNHRTLLCWKLVIHHCDWCPHMHLILRLALTLAPGSCDVDGLFSLLNRVNRHDRRRLPMPKMEMLFVVA